MLLNKINKILFVLYLIIFYLIILIYRWNCTTHLDKKIFAFRLIYMWTLEYLRKMSLAGSFVLLIILVMSYLNYIFLDLTTFNECRRFIRYLIWFYIVSISLLNYRLFIVFFKYPKSNFIRLSTSINPNCKYRLEVLMGVFQIIFGLFLIINYLIVCKLLNIDLIFFALYVLLIIYGLYKLHTKIVKEFLVNKEWKR